MWLAHQKFGNVETVGCGLTQKLSCDTIVPEGRLYQYYTNLSHLARNFPLSSIAIGNAASKVHNDVAALQQAGPLNLKKI